MKLSKKAVIDWFNKHKKALNQFEEALVSSIEKKGTEVGYLADMNESESPASLLYKGDNDIVEESAIALNPILNKEDAILYRIVAIAHEASHLGDLLDNYGGNMHKFEETDTIQNEEDAWKICIILLEKSGFDKFGYLGWIGVRNVMADAIASYYADRYSDSSYRADKFAYSLLKSKLNQ